VIRRPEIQKIVNGYDDLRIAVLGSHSALEIMDGAKDEGLNTIVFCQKGRETPYQRFDRIADEIKILKKFSEMSSTKNQKMLRDTNTIIIPHRSLTAYLGYNVIENSLKVPIFGNRALFQAEERNNKKNQYYLLKKAGIKYPKIFKNPKDINKPAIVKVQEKKRRLERAFFTVSSFSDYKKKSESKIKQGIISKNDLKNAVIEQLVIGTYFVQTSQITESTVLAGIVIGVLSSLVLFITSFPDHDADKAKGRKTLVISLGMQKACSILWIFPGITYGITIIAVVFEIFPVFCLIILSTVPLIIKSGQKLKQNYNKLTNLIPVMSSTLYFSRITGVLLVVGFLVNII